MENMERTAIQTSEGRRGPSAAEKRASHPQHDVLARRGMLSLCDPLLSDLTLLRTKWILNAIRQHHEGLSIPDVARLVAREIRKALSKGNHGLKGTKKTVAALLSAHECPEVDGRSFNKWTREKFESAPEGTWEEMYIGHVRRALLPSEDVDVFLRRALIHRREVVRGIEGYRRVASLLFNGNMLKAYTRMSALCGAAKVEMKELQWGNAFQGTAQEFREGAKEGAIAP